jgi:MoaA/NifB/PqqE/SkfB family radical SAM enzyme
MPRHFSTHRLLCWRVTENCNRACPFCLSLSGPRIDHPHANAIRTLERLLTLGVEKLSYSGGEPTGLPRFETLVKAAAAMGMKQILTTNGDRFVRAIPEWVFEFEYIKLSFYGTDELHDKYMGPGHYQSQIELATKLQAEWRVIVGVNYMVTPFSVNQIPAFLVDCQRAGIDNVMFQTYILNGREKVDRVHYLSNPGEVIHKIAELVRPYSGNFIGGLKIHDYTKKNWFMVLTPTSRLILPSSDGTPDHSMGSVFDDTLCLPDGTRLRATDALEAIWSARFETDAIVVFDEGVSRSSD